MLTARKLISSFFLSNPWLVTAAFLSNIISSLLNIIIPLSIGRFYELVLHDQSVKGRLFDALGVSLDSTTAFFQFFLLLITAKGFMAFADHFLTGVLGERFSRELRERLFRTQLSHSVTTHNLKPAGKYLLRYSGDLVFIQRFITQGTIQFTGDVIFMITSLAVLYSINATLTLILAGGILIAVLIILLLSRILRTATLNRRNQRSVLLGFVANRMNAFFTVKSFNREAPEELQYNKRSGKLYDLGIRYYRISSVIQGLLPLLFFGTLAIVLYFISSERVTKPYGIHRSEALDFVLLFLYMQAVIRRILKVNVVWQAGSVSFYKLLRILNLPAEAKAQERELTGIDGRITFDHVSFQFANADAPLFNDLTFTLEPHSIIQVKGKQGAGKSTLLKIIQGVYAPVTGKIFLDEYDYAALAPNDIRRNVTIVSDETPLLGSTVFKAISYSRSVEKKEKAMQALAQVNFRVADSDEENLGFKLDDYGKNLSAGQRRQLMFARAFLTRKKIILLDDALDDLDAETKMVIVKRINRLKEKRTIIIAANNLPPEVRVDLVIQLGEHQNQKQPVSL